MRSLYNLSLGKKLAIIVIGLLLPSAWLLLKLVSQQEVTIATAELKLQGLEYMHRIWRLSGPLADHRSMGLRYASGKPEDLEIAHNKVAEVDAAIKSVDEYENLVDERLRNGAEWRDVMKRWRVLRDRKSELNAAQYFAGHSEVLDTLATFNQRLANRSTLLYEAEETTHFLVDVVVRDIPQVQNGIFSLRRAVVVGSGTANVMNPQRADLAARVHVVSVDAKSLRTNVEQLAAALPESATRLRAAVDAYKSVAEQYAKTVEDNMVMADNRARWQREHLVRLDKAQELARHRGIGRDVLIKAFGRMIYPDPPFVYDADLLDLPEKGRSVDLTIIRREFGPFFANAPEPRPEWMTDPRESWPPKDSAIGVRRPEREGVK